MHDPYAALNEAHREAIDTPWSAEPRHLNADDMVGRKAEPLLDAATVFCLLALIILIGILA